MAKRGKRQKSKVSRRTKQVNSPEEYDQLISGAAVDYQTGKVREAEQICFDILGQEPNHADALHLLGDIAYGQGQYEGAIGLYEQSLGSKSKNGHKLHNNIGLALEKQGKIDEAIAHYRKALSINPKHGSSHSNLGKALYLQGKIAEAIACWQRAINLRPDDPKAHNNLGMALGRQLEYDRAIGHLQQALACKPNYAEAYNNLGIIKEKQEKYSEAIAYYQQAIALDPNRADIHKNIANTLGRQGKLSEAIAHLRRAVSLNPKEAEYNYNLAVVLQKQKKLPEAIGYYQQAIGLKPDYGQAYNNLGTVLQDQGRLTEAISYYQQAIKLEPDSAEAHNNLGSAYQEQGNITEAIANYREAIGLRPDYREARANLGPVLLLSGDWQRGFAEYEWRWQIPEFAGENPLPSASKPRWQGEDLQGRTLLITREQGFGDMIQFIRYAKAVGEQQTGGGRVRRTRNVSLISVELHFEANMSKQQKPNEFQKVVRKWIRILIDGSKFPSPPQKPNEFQKVGKWIRILIDGSKFPSPPHHPPKKGTESWYRDRLADELGGETEVTVPSGRIDVVTQTEVIEVKRVSQWKSALGQVLAYKRSFPNHQARIHLIGEPSQSRLDLIQQECQQYGVKVTWEP